MQHFRPQDPVALLIDGENLSAAHAPEIREMTERAGPWQVARIYGDAARIGAWSAMPGGVLMHTAAGKNAADIALSIAAVHLLHATPIRRFVLASSDGDLAQVAIHLREWGAEVTGIGDAQAPRAFRQACHAFHELGAVAKPAVTGGAAPAAAGNGAATAAAGEPRVPLYRLISDLIAQAPGGAMPIQKLDAAVRIKRPNFQIKTHADRSWGAYLRQRPKMFVCDPKGPQARVRLVATPSQDA